MYQHRLEENNLEKIRIQHCSITLCILFINSDRSKRNRIRQLKELMDSISTNDEFFKSNPQITSVNNFFNKLIDKLAEEC